MYIVTNRTSGNVYFVEEGREEHESSEEEEQQQQELDLRDQFDDPAPSFSSSSESQSLTQKEMLETGEWFSLLSDGGSVWFFM